MRIRHFVAVLAVLALMLTMVVSAGAETTLEQRHFTWYSAKLNPSTKVLMVEPQRNSGYMLMDLNGNPINGQTYIDFSTDNNLYKVAQMPGVNVHGMINSAGDVLVPMMYGDVDRLSDRWQVGIVYEDATEENYDAYAYDYSVNPSVKRFYLYSRYDLYFQGQLVGCLGRTEYKYAYAHGNYVWVNNHAGNYTAYDSQFNKSPYEVKSSSEFDYNYKTKTVYHTATGIPAFTPGCPLTADDVETSIYEISGKFVDLQGNVLFQDEHYSVYAFKGDYCRFRSKAGQYGLIDLTGAEKLAAEFDEIPTNSADRYFNAGYQLVKKDGKLGFVEEATGKVNMTIYPAGASYSYRGPFIFIKDLDGSYIAVSGAVGELSEHYTNYEVNYYGTSPIFAATNANKESGVVGLGGEVLIPFSAEYDYASDFTISTDGTVVLARGDYSNGMYPFDVYLVDYDMSAFAPKAEPAVEPAPAASSDWTCATCGTVNTGKFCTECGSPKPAADWVCSTCGNINSGKFCPECGTPRP